MNIEAIGVITSPAIDAIDEGWGSVISEIHLHRRRGCS